MKQIRNDIDGEYVKCEICDFKGKMLNRHLARHGITAVEYHIKFPNSKLATGQLPPPKGGGLE